MDLSEVGGCSRWAGWSGFVVGGRVGQSGGLEGVEFQEGIITGMGGFCVHMLSRERTPCKEIIVLMDCVFAR